MLAWRHRSGAPAEARTPALLKVLLGAYLLVSLALPLVLLFVGAGSEGGATGGHAVLGAELWLRSLARALALGAVVGAGACLAAYPLAGAVPTPILCGLFLVSPLARALGVLGLGLPPGAGAVALAQLGGALPLAGLLVNLRLRSIDPQWLDAGADLGAGAWLRFRLITLPLIRPALATAALWAGLISLGDVATLELAGGGKFFALPLLLHELAFAAEDPLALALITAVILALALPCAVVLCRGITGAGGAPAMVGREPGRTRAKVTQLLALLALLIAVLPLLGLILSLPGVHTSEATLTALGSALVPTARGLPLLALFATAGGFLLARRSARLPLWLGALLVLPLAIPSAVQGILVLEIGRLVGARPGELLTLWGLWPSSLALAFVGARLAIAGVPQALGEAARDLGAGFGIRARQLWLPLVGPASAGVMLIVFALNLGAVSVPAFTSGPGGSTLAVALTILARGSGSAAVGLVTLGLALLPLVLVPALGRLLAPRAAPRSTGAHRRERPVANAAGRAERRAERRSARGGET